MICYGGSGGPRWNVEMKDCVTGHTDVEELRMIQSFTLLSDACIKIVRMEMKWRL